MSYDQTILERLERELNDADADREKLQEELDSLKEYATWAWARHKQIEKEADPLPVPRLQIEGVNVSGDWYVTDWIYSMVYEHLLGHYCIVPLGHTRSTGGGRRPPDADYTPFRDGAHIRHEAKTFGWPAFQIVEGKARLIESS